MPVIDVDRTQKLISMSNSVGAILVKQFCGSSNFLGTCFRTGTVYVITNYHVWKSRNSSSYEYVYVDFNYNGLGTSSKFEFKTDECVFGSQEQELDYAILKLNLLDFKLLPPPSLLEYGYVIPRDNTHLDNDIELSLIGHPGGTSKKIDVTCPIKRLNNWWDKNTQTYVSTFYQGSSGSPGVLMDKGMLVVLHCRRSPINDGQSDLAEGIMMSAIFQDVYRKTNFNDKIIEDIFGRQLFCESMEIDS